MTISARIASLLRHTANTQKSIAELLHIRPSTVNYWIKSNAESIPSDYIMPLCRFFEVAPEELLEGNLEERLVLTAEEHRLVRLFRTLPEDSKTLIIADAIREQRHAQEESRTT